MNYANYPAVAYIIIGILVLVVLGSIPGEIEDYKIRRRLRRARKERKNK